MDKTVETCLAQAGQLAASDPSISAFWQLSCHAMKKAADEAIKAAGDRIELNSWMLGGLIGFAIGAFLVLIINIALS